MGFPQLLHEKEFRTMMHLGLIAGLSLSHEEAARQSRIRAVHAGHANDHEGVQGRIAEADGGREKGEAV
jgi:hypothetical protein